MDPPTEQPTHLMSNRYPIWDPMRQHYKELSAQEVGRIAAVKEHGTHMYRYLDTLGNSRELSIAKTRLEESVMWAVKHLTF